MNVALTLNARASYSPTLACSSPELYVISSPELCVIGQSLEGFKNLFQCLSVQSPRGRSTFSLFNNYKLWIFKCAGATTLAADVGTEHHQLKYRTPTAQIATASPTHRLELDDDIVASPLRYEAFLLTFITECFSESRWRLMSIPASHCHLPHTLHRTHRAYI